MASRFFEALIVAAAATLTAQSPADRSQAEALSRRAADRMAALQREAESLAKQEQTLLTELRKLEVERELKAAQLAQIEADAAQVQQRIDATAARARDLQAAADRQRPDVEARLVQLYKMGRAGYWRLLLDVNSLRDVTRAYRTAAAMGRIDRDRVQEHARTLEDLRKERTALEARSRELDQLRAKARDARAAVERAFAARTALVHTIDQRRDLNAQLAGELQDAQQRLHASLAQIAAGHPTPPPVLPLRPFEGALPWPADGVVSARFGRQAGRYGSTLVRSGIELSLPEGQPIRAIYDGTVAYADAFSGYGNLVIVDHGDRSYSLYGHLASFTVHKGDHVDAGATVGLAGRNPAGNPALYFELRVDGKPVDPLQWLKRQ
jgi:murein hydrolase activator